MEVNAMCKLCVAGFVLGLALLLMTSASADWLTLQLTDDGFAESMPSVDLDPYGIPALAWCSNDDGDYEIYYLPDIAGTAITATANTTNDLYPCLRFDQAGNAHIGFKGYDGHDYEEYYVHNIGGAFCDPIQVTFTGTDVGVFVPERSCLAIDSSGTAHIVYKYGYYEYGNWDIYYVNNEGGAFGEPIRITNGDGRTSYVRPAIALDTAGFVHVVFENGSAIIYTNNTLGSFGSLITVSQGAYRWHSSVAVDVAGAAHISYGGYHGGVYYVTNVGGAFDSTAVLSQENSMNGPTALVLGSADEIHVAYIGGTFGNTNSQEAYYVTGSNGSFADPERITENSEHTVDICVSVDTRNTCHIGFLEGFYGSNDYEVWYATNADYAGMSDFDEFAGDGCSRMRLRCCPSPFSASTQIEYTLREQGSVRLSIHNVLGRIVRVLVDEEQQGGGYKVVWDGKDAGGRQLPMGIYLSRLSAGGRSAATKLILVP
jgi:hypothetical protein